MLTEVLRALATLWPAPVTVDDGLDRTLAFVGFSVTGETVHRASYVVAVVCVLVASVLGTLVSDGVVVATPFLALATLVAYAGPGVPRLIATAKRTRALGAAPSLVSRAALSMRLSPAPERAAAFAAEAGDGVLADSLAGHVRRSAASPGSGFHPFAREWRPWFPELERACALVETAGDVPAEQRPATLDRARTAVLDAARDRMADFAASIRGPATAVYAFGVMLPLALVSLLPALRAAGIPASTPMIALLYDFALPVGLIAASAWLLARRPVAFPPPVVDRSHPDVPSGRWRGPVSGVVAGSLVWVLTPLVLPPWTVPIGVAGATVGTLLVVRYHPYVRVRTSVVAVEEGLSDALALLGQRIERGESVESALPGVAAELPGPTGDVLGAAATRQRRLGVDVEAAFLGPGGALVDVPSRRTRSAAVLLSLAASEGRPAGEAVTAMGDHLGELATVQEAARRSVEQVTSTLSNTAAVFGPLVGGSTVALAGAMGSAGPLAGGAMATALGIAVGGYVLLLAAILTVLSTGLERGFDRALVGYRVGIALLGATATYLAAFVGTGLAV